MKTEAEVKVVLVQGPGGQELPAEAGREAWGRFSLTAPDGTSPGDTCVRASGPQTVRPWSSAVSRPPGGDASLSRPQEARQQTQQVPSIYLQRRHECPFYRGAHRGERLEDSAKWTRLGRGHSGVLAGVVLTGGDSFPFSLPHTFEWTFWFSARSESIPQGTAPRVPSGGGSHVPSHGTNALRERCPVGPTDRSGDRQGHGSAP